MTDRLARYEARTSKPLLVLALLFIAIYALPILEPDLPASLATSVEVAAAAIWGLFALDLAVRVALADQRIRYLLTHPIDVATVVLPALRPLRVLRIFTAGQALVSRAGHLSIARTTQAAAVSAGLLVAIGSLAMLDAERDGVDANITDIGDAVWWAATTVTTVGYGDHYPVSATGRIVAVALMLVGISLVGVITASVAAWFITLTTAAERKDRRLDDRLDTIEQQLAYIRSALDEQTRLPR